MISHHFPLHHNASEKLMMLSPPNSHFCLPFADCLATFGIVCGWSCCLQTGPLCSWDISLPSPLFSSLLANTFLYTIQSVLCLQYSVSSTIEQLNNVFHPSFRLFTIFLSCRNLSYLYCVPLPSIMPCTFE